MDELLAQLLVFLEQLEANFEDLSEEEAAEVSNFIQEVIQHITTQTQPITPPPQPEEPEIAPIEAPLQPLPSDATQLLWILSGSKIDAFVNYLNTFPDPELQALLRNPTELDNTIRQLHAMMPTGEQPVSEGIQHADINSSNIYGFKYDPNTGKLLVKFQGSGESGQGPIYEYSNVPKNIFNIFRLGAVPAKTSGRNKFGVWWRGKMPSLGAAMYELIKKGGYPYQRLS